jgi:two-component system response regulator RegX3
VHLLVVEDDPTIADPLCVGLRREGFEVTHLDRGTDAAAAAEHADLVLLDLGLPDLDGRVVCRSIRAGSNVPIIVVSARSDEIDRVTLLEIGADDYVVKPFGFRELAARIGAVLRRTGSTAATDPTELTVGELTIDARARAVAIGQAPVVLTPKEYDLLAYLASDAGAVKTREEIIRDVWDENWWGSTKTLDVHIASLRKKLGPDWIHTVRRVGFMLSAPT